MTNRISLSTQFTGSFKHLKRNIKDLLKRRGVGHILQTTQVNDSQKQTSLFMEGESTVLYNVQAQLVSHLQSTFPGISIEDWREMASDAPIFDSFIVPTPGSLSRDSSGFVEELDESSVVQTQRPEQSEWKDNCNSGFLQLVTAIQKSRQVAYEIRSSIDSIKEKFVHITYKLNTVHLNIGACILWSQLLQLIQACEGLQIKKPIKGIYSLVDGKKSFETDWFGFKDECHYYVETEDDLVQQFSTMDEFFEKLKTDEDMSDDQVAVTKDKFGSQGITFKQLMKTGDLALTDAELERVGISQLGLRKAILAVIKSNQ
jgi:hypothetical protein